MLWYLLLCGVVLTVDGYDFNPGRTRYIDQATLPSGVTNYLFRGNEPIINKTMAYQPLLFSLRQAATNVSVELPSSFYVLDVSLLNPTELPDEEVEKKFWKGNPTLGGYINWVIVGSALNASSVEPASSLPQKAKTLDSWSIDKLPHKMDLLKQFLSTAHGRNSTVSTVIYIHCEAGTDRTGEISGSYYMKWLNQSFQQALNYDDHINSRVIKPLSQNSLQWYCYYLQYAENRTMDCAALPSLQNSHVGLTASSMSSRIHSSTAVRAIGEGLGFRNGGGEAAEQAATAPKMAAEEEPEPGGKAAGTAAAAAIPKVAGSAKGAPTGAYCGNASYLVLFAKIQMSFYPDGAEANVTAKVDLLPLVDCTKEQYAYDPVSGHITLTNIVNASDCVGKFVKVMGGKPTEVSLVYNATHDTLSAGFEGEYCVFTKAACRGPHASLLSGLRTPTLVVAAGS